MDNTRMENTVQELASIQSQCQELIDRIREIEKEIEQDNEPEPKFERLGRNEMYFYLSESNGRPIAFSEHESNDIFDDVRFNNNNYFKTVERAKEVTDKINFLLRLERLHDTFCPDYVPNWNSDEAKFTIYYNHEKVKPRYKVQPYCYMRHPTTVYFPSKEIAQKVCDILNNELEDNNYEN